MKDILDFYSHFFFVILLFFSCQSEKVETIKFKKSVTSIEELQKQSEQFNKKEVIEVIEGIHVAIGFGLANSILIEGENGNIIVDCTESNEVAEKVKVEFNKISTKPITAIIYTHNHTDHVFGAGVMAGNSQPDVYSHELTNYYIDRIVSIIRPVIGRRSYRMFGVHLDEKSRVNCGIGPFLDANEHTTRSLL